MQATNVSHLGTLKFSNSTFIKVESEIVFIIFYLPQYIQNIIM